MKKALALILLLSIAFPVKSLGYYGDYSALFTDNYVLKVPNDLTQQAVFQNKFMVNLVPKISIDSAASAFQATYSADLFSNPSDKYALVSASSEATIDIKSEVSIEFNQVISKIEIKNNGNAAVQVNLDYDIAGKGQFSMFSPENYNNVSKNYMVVMQPDLDGQALGIIGSSLLRPSFTGLYPQDNYMLSFTTAKLGPGETLSLELKFYPFTVRKEGGTAPLYPPELFSFMSEPLIDTSGSIAAIGEATTLSEKVDAMIEAVTSIAKKSDSSFTELHNVALSSTTGFDSLDSAEYFKQLCIQNDVPCRLVIGKSEDTYYAWVKAYNGQWVDVDVQNSEKQTPSYSAYYTEPTAEFHAMPYTDDNNKAAYEGTTWIAYIGQANFLIYFLVIIVIASSGVVFVMFRRAIMAKLLAGKGMTSKPVIEINGKYEILSEAIDDAFMKEIISKIKERGGIVNLDQMAETTHFSKELLEEGIRYLIDQKFARKIA